MKKKITSIILLSCISTIYAQSGRVGINTTTPQTTLQVAGKPTDATSLDGIQAPLLTGNELIEKNYTTAQTGALVYVTEVGDAPAGQTVNVTSTGYYYFDGSVWVSTKGSGGSPVTTTNLLVNPVNTMSSTVNGVLATARVVNTVANEISGGDIITRVNGIASSNTPITNVLSSSGNTMSSVVAGGNAATAPIINSVANTTVLTGNNNSLVTTVNGIPSTSVNVPNLYTANGTLTGNRTVTEGTNTLTFSGSAVGATKFLSTANVSPIQIQDGAQAAGKVLTSDATGNATWKTPAAGGTGTVTNVSGISPINVATGTTTPVVSLADSGVAPGTYTSVTVDAKGLVTAASNPVSNTTNTLTNPTNTITSTVNGVTATAPAVNTVANTTVLTGNNNSLVTTVNGVASTSINVPNLYTANGTLTGNRTVTQNANTLTFTGTATGMTTFNNTSGTAASQNAALKIIDGGQASGKVLTSDAAGNATWEDTSLGIIGGSLPTTGYNFVDADRNVTYRDTGASITLPPGKWMVVYGSSAHLLGFPSTSRLIGDGQLWIVTTLANSPSGTPSADRITTYGGSNGAAGSLGRGEYVTMVTGAMAINNSTTANKTYYVSAVQYAYGTITSSLTTTADAGNVKDFFGSSNQERYFYAVPLK